MVQNKSFLGILQFGIQLCKGICICVREATIIEISPSLLGPSLYFQTVSLDTSTKIYTYSCFHQKNFVCMCGVCVYVCA